MCGRYDLAIRSHLIPTLLVLLGWAAPGTARADGILIPGHRRAPARAAPAHAGPSTTADSGRQRTLWESYQEAIIIQDRDALTGRALENMVLRIRVRSLEDIDSFAWVIPFPNPPEAALEDTKLFEEIRRHVTGSGETSAGETPRGGGNQAAGATPSEEARIASRGAASGEPSNVSVISRKVLGGYEVVIVRALEKGALEAWLEKEGFQGTEYAGNDVVESYRKKGHVFACVKVRDPRLVKGATVELQPLRFAFETGGRDGIFFPMKMTSLQTEPFDLALHIFGPAPIDEKESRFGYAHRGLRPWSPAKSGEGDAAKGSGPGSPPGGGRVGERDFSRMPGVADLLRRVRPGGERYLASIGASGLNPRELDGWADDLWLFPRYHEPGFVPFDARPGGPAAAGWAKADLPEKEKAPGKKADPRVRRRSEEDPSERPVPHAGVEEK
jgi:hypothetical protein